MEGVTGQQVFREVGPHGRPEYLEEQENLLKLRIVSDVSEGSPDYNCALCFLG